MAVVGIAERDAAQDVAVFADPQLVVQPRTLRGERRLGDGRDAQAGGGEQEVRDIGAAIDRTISRQRFWR